MSNTSVIRRSYLRVSVTCLRLVGLCPNTPLQTDARPISWVYLLCLMHGNAFVKTSAVCSGSLQLSKWITLSCTKPCTQCQCMAICLDFLWNIGLFAIAIDPSLSLKICIRISAQSNPSSVWRLWSQHASCAASDMTTYSASVEDCACVICFLELHLITPLLAMNTYSVVDLYLSVFL